MTKILVSICCITYNHEKFINKCIDGFLLQKTKFNFEILIHDDASTDNTANIIREYENRYPDIIKPIYQIENQYSKGVSISATFNWPRAKGKYIAMCEGDDYWTDPLKLQKQVDFLEKKNDYGLIHTDFNTFYQNSNFTLVDTHKIFRINLIGDCSLKYWNLLNKAPATIKTLTVCFRKCYLNEWQTMIESQRWLVGDFPLYFYISLISKIGYIPHSTAVYRTVSEGSASNVGKNDGKKLLLKKTYIDIRLYFISHFEEINNKKYFKALKRDLNELIDYCLITNNKNTLENYYIYFAQYLPNRHIDRAIKITSSKNSLKKIVILKIVQLKILFQTYYVKLFNIRFIACTFKRILNKALIALTF